MMTKLSILGVVAVAFLACFGHVEGNPAIALSGYDTMGICIENCAQCKKIFGDWFEGELCAINCIKLKGKVIPDCEDAKSISPFINKLKYLAQN